MDFLIAGVSIVAVIWVFIGCFLLVKRFILEWMDYDA